MTKPCHRAGERRVSRPGIRRQPDPARLAGPRRGPDRPV